MVNQIVHYTEDNKTKRYHSINDQPAVIWEDGDEEWWYQGKLHRDHEPAIVRHGRNIKEWWCHGKRHRIGGPALEEPSGNWYYVDGKYMTYGEYKTWMLVVHLVTYEEEETSRPK